MQASIASAKKSTAAKQKRKNIAAGDDTRMTAAKAVVAVAVMIEGTTNDGEAAAKNITKRKVNESALTPMPMATKK